MILSIQETLREILETCGHNLAMAQNQAWHASAQWASLGVQDWHHRTNSL